MKQKHGATSLSPAKDGSPEGALGIDREHQLHPLANLVKQGKMCNAVVRQCRFGVNGAPDADAQQQADAHLEHAALGERLAVLMRQERHEAF